MKWPWVTRRHHEATLATYHAKLAAARLECTVMGGPLGGQQIAVHPLIRTVLVPTVGFPILRYVTQEEPKPDDQPIVGYHQYDVRGLLVLRSADQS